MAGEQKARQKRDYRTFKWKGIHTQRWHGRQTTVYIVEIDGKEHTCGAHTFAEHMQRWRQAMTEE